VPPHEKITTNYATVFLKEEGHLDELKEEL
jgi:hypothetical protein